MQRVESMELKFEGIEMQKQTELWRSWNAKPKYTNG